MAKRRATIEMQEGIIARLEGLLEQSVVDQRRLAEAEAIASRVQDANTVLQAGPDWEELSMLRDEVKDLRTAYSEREQDHKDLQSERIALTLRAEKAEANAIASNNEMLDVSRKAAREIASLRAKLAEKDAQLMGGFGSVANMVLRKMPRRRGSRRWSRSPRSTPRRPERESSGDTSRPNRKQTRRRGGRRRRRRRRSGEPVENRRRTRSRSRDRNRGTAKHVHGIVRVARVVARGVRRRRVSPGSVGGGSRPASRASAASAGSRPLTGDKPGTPDR